MSQLIRPSEQLPSTMVIRLPFKVRKLMAWALLQLLSPPMSTYLNLYLEVSARLRSSQAASSRLALPRPPSHALGPALAPSRSSLNPRSLATSPAKRLGKALVDPRLARRCLGL